MKNYINEAVVIGSGPTGIISAQKLASKNIKTLIIDYGKTIEENIETNINKLRNIEENQWSDENLHKLHGDKKMSLSKIPLKLLFGSSFMYAFSSMVSNITFKNIDYIISFAKGGLSNVWGGAILPYRKEEFDNWPINYQDLIEHYKFVLDKIGFSYYADDLDEFFPKYSNNIKKLNLSDQMISFEKKLLKNKKILNRLGFIFGRSRLAVNQLSRSCIYCGGCLYGCPKSIIYNSADSLEVLLKNTNISYKSNLLVKKIIEEKDVVKIVCKDSNDNYLNIYSKRVYLGAGAVSSTNIMLNSYKFIESDTELTLKDSQYFFIPAIINYSQPFINKDKIHTLCQYFLEIKNDNNKKNWSHLQIYGYNDLLKNKIKEKFGALYFIFNFFIERFFLDKIIFIQGYLHSDLSRKASIKIKTKTEQDIELEIKQINNKYTIHNVKKIVTVLKKHSNLLGFYPIKTLLSIGRFGRGFHVGGSLPMSKISNKIGKSDIWGRPYMFKNVHIIDSSIMPTIASTTITLTSMANAVRIVDNHKNY